MFLEALGVGAYGALGVLRSAAGECMRLPVLHERLILMAPIRLHTFGRV